MIVDDHPLFCDALSIVLTSAAGISSVTTADSLNDALEVLNDAPLPDVLLLDLNLPDVNGLDGLLRLRARHPELPLLVVSSMSDNRTVSATLRAGARGFVPKHSHRDIFRSAFDAIWAGETYHPEGYIEPASEDGERDESVARLASLTRQQARILRLICDGKLNKQIAFDLSIAETTVKAHVTAIMRKLGVQSRTQAVLVAQQARYAHLLPEG